MQAWPLLRNGDCGDAVRDVQQRLTAAGHPLTIDGDFGDETTKTVQVFQEHRGLRADGICGPETWAALIESGYVLGDRLLYVCAPMLRGDDVAELQRRLNALGFHAGREDGILGPDTAEAVQAFQRDAGLSIDGVLGPATLDALMRLGSLAGGSVATVREREALRHGARRLEGLRVFVCGDLGVATLCGAVAAGLRERGALVTTDTSGDDPTFIAAAANRFDAAAFIGLFIGEDPPTRCAYFANKSFRSEAGFCLANRLSDALAGVVGPVEPPVGRTYRLLRETRMAAVVCELVGRRDPSAVAALTQNLAAVARAIVAGVQRGVEEPVAPTGD